MRVTEEELVRWGRRIGERVRPPLFIGLRGGLGAGKSVLARAVAWGAGVQGSVPSPTFNLLFRYDGRDGTVLTHLDLYRLRDPSELWELGWEDLGRENEVVVVEWPERAGALLPEDRWEIAIDRPDGADHLRDVSVSRMGQPGPLPGFPIAVSGEATPT